MYFRLLEAKPIYPERKEAGVTIRRRSTPYAIVVVLLLLATAAFASAPAPASDEATTAAAQPERDRWFGPLRGGVLATFDVHGDGDGDIFRVWTTNPAAIEQLFALARGESTARIPIGPLRYGRGRAAHNAPWSWHFDPEQFRLAEAAIELCEARPSFVEANLHYFIKVVRAYCPGAVLVGLKDFRKRRW